MRTNIPEIKLGIVAVSRDCFPITLSESRLHTLMGVLETRKVNAIATKTIVENENDSVKALKELEEAGVNALVVYLGNFGPEGPETIVAERFNGPVMFVAAAEESIPGLSNDRGDAYCGMLNASYNLQLRGINAYIPEYPVGDAEETASMIEEFIPIARVYIGVKNLKILSYGPRPYDFLACNAPIKPLYDIGVNIMENSELDLLVAYNKHAGDKRIPDVIKDMEAELGNGNKHPGILERLAQYEVTLMDLIEENVGASKYVALANKCWPAFQTEFKFVPCYVNSRLTSNLIPVSCETDIYGALSEYIICCATGISPTLLDINNSVPKDLYNEAICGKYDYKLTDTFMGFHCGNTPKEHLCSATMKHQLIMKRTLEPDTEPDITRGTLEGDIAPGDITFFRLQSTAGGKLQSYVAQGEVLPVPTHSFGGIGIFAIPEMGRFYRHVLIADGYPHHGGVAFGKVGKILFAAMKLLGIEKVSFNQPKNMLYKDENPFA